MFVYNVKFNSHKILKGFLIVMAVICIAVFCVAIYKIYTGMKADRSETQDCFPITDGVAEIEADNYTNILKMVNEDIDTYIGQQISFTGYVYRVSDIGKDQFVLARDMVIASNPTQTVVVGFLSECKNASEYENYTWVKVTATIEKGEYCGEVPLLSISEIEVVSKPENATVPLPDDYYVPTAVIY